MKHLFTLFLGGVVTLASRYALAQSTVPPNPSGQNLPGPFNPILNLQFGLCCLAIAFGLIVLVGQFILLRKVDKLSSDDIVKNVTISVVIVGALLLIIAGYDSQQTAQAFGLFGTIVGYLLGRSAGKDEKNANDGN